MKKTRFDLKPPFRWTACPIKNIKCILREFKYAWQRMLYGYSDYDLWDIDLWFKSVVPKMLREFKDNTFSYPNDLTPDGWRETLERMAYLMDCDRHESEENEIFEKDDADYKLYWETSQRHHKEIEEGLELFVKWFHDLWW